MTDLLIRIFVPHADQTTNPTVRMRYSTLAGFVGLICNIGLFCLKFTLGLMLGALSVTADSFNNLSDASSSVISLIGAKIAGQPADQKHPFGHGRIEYIATLLVAGAILGVGFSSARDAVRKILHPSPTALSLIPMVLLVLSVLVKIWLSCFHKKLGKKISSSTLLAAGTDAANDVLVTGVTILSILFEHITGFLIDGPAGLVVSVFVILSGLSIANETLHPLIGAPEDSAFAQKITDLVTSQPGILGTHDLIMHNYGPNSWFVSIHAELDSRTTFNNSHRIVDAAEREVEDRLHIQIVIHADPIDTKDPRIQKAREELQQVLTALDSRITFHDLRIIDGTNHINLIFDIIVPFDYSPDMRKKLLYNIQADMLHFNPRYHCHIRLDSSYQGTAG